MDGDGTVEVAGVAVVVGDGDLVGEGAGDGRGAGDGAAGEGEAGRQAGNGEGIAVPVPPVAARVTGVMAMPLTALILTQLEVTGGWTVTEQLNLPVLPLLSVTVTV